MKWKRFTIDTTTEAIDFISDMLNERGVEGIEIEDNVPLTEQETKGMFVDILPELPPRRWPGQSTFLSFRRSADTGRCVPVRGRAPAGGGAGDFRGGASGFRPGGS